MNTFHSWRRYRSGIKLFGLARLSDRLITKLLVANAKVSMKCVCHRYMNKRKAVISWLWDIQDNMIIEFNLGCASGSGWQPGGLAE